MNHPCKRKTMAFLQALFFNRAKHLAGSPVKVSSLSKCFLSSPGANIPRIQKRMKDFLPSTSWADQFCFQSFMSRFGECNKSTILSNTRPLTQGRLKACQDLVFRSSLLRRAFFTDDLYTHQSAHAQLPRDLLSFREPLEPDLPSQTKCVFSIFCAKKP